MIGRHVLLSPVRTAVKPAYSVFGNHPNPIQEGEVAMLSAEYGVDVMLGLWKNIGLTKKRGVIFNEILRLITCRRVRFSHRTERHI